MRSRTLAKCLAATLILPGAALAQEEFSVEWHTVDCGGGTSNGEEFVVFATIAQPDAGVLIGPETGESFSIVGGYWVDGGLCYPNCDGSSGNPVLTPNDFQCFLNRYANGDSYANCDGSTGAPVLTPNDFLCFLNAYANECP